MNTTELNELYALDTPYPRLRQLVKKFLLVDRRFLVSKSCNFWEEFEARYEFDDTIDRLCNLMRYFYLRNEDYKMFKAWCWNPANHDHPRYEDMIMAVRFRDDDHLYDPRIKHAPVAGHGMDPNTQGQRVLERVAQHLPEEAVEQVTEAAVNAIPDSAIEQVTNDVVDSLPTAEPVQQSDTTQAPQEGM